MALDPNVDVEKYIQETISSELAKSQAALTNQQVTPEPLSIKIGQQEFKYNTPQELEASVNQFVGAAASELAKLQTQVQTQQQTNVQGSLVSGDEAPSWSDEAFIKKMQESPKEGMLYALNQLLLDGKSDNAAEDIKSQLRDVELTKRSIAAYQFKEAHPEFLGGMEAANKIDQLRQAMNLPYNLEGLEAAYLMGMQRQQLPNYYQIAQQNQMQQLQNQTQNQGQLSGYVPGTLLQQNSYLQGPPSVGRGNQGQTGQANYDPENLSIEQLENVINQIAPGTARR